MSDVQPADATPNETPAWLQLANCRGVDPDLFYGDRWGNPNDAAHAKAVCNGCVVREDCLSYALTQPEIHGIWGGLSPVERRAERRQRGINGLRRVHPADCGCPSCALKNRWETA